MATYEQLAAALQGAHQAGDTEAATRLASELRNMKTAQTSAQQPAPVDTRAKLAAIEPPNWMERQAVKIPGALQAMTGAPIVGSALGYLGRALDGGPEINQVRGFAQGAADPVLGIAQMASRIDAPTSQRVDAAIKAKNDQYEAMRGKDAGFDGSRALGNLAMTALPLSKIAAVPTLLGRTAQGAMLGAGTSLAQPVYDNQGEYGAEKLKQGLMGGLGGAVMTPATEMAARGIGALVGKFMKNPNAAKQAATNMDELVRKGDFAAIGVQPTTGQITRDPAQFSWELNKRGQIPELTQRFNQQNSQLLEALNQVQRKTGGSANGYQTGQSMIDALAAFDAAQKAGVTKAYDAARTASGGNIELNASPLAQKFGEVVETYGSGNIPGAVKRALNAYGLGGAKQTKSYTPTEADQLIKVINANYDPMRKAESGALDSLRAGVRSTMEGDALTPLAGEAASAYAAARKEAANRFSLLDSLPGLKAVSDNRAVPDDFFKKNVLIANKSQIETLAKTLKDRPEVWADVRAQAVDFLKSKATNGAADEVATFSQAGYNKALSANKDRLSALFDAAEMEKLERLGRVSSYVQSAPVGNVVNRSNTLTAALGKGMIGASRLPFANLLAESITKAKDTRQASQALKGLLSAPESYNPASAFAGNIGLLSPAMIAALQQSPQ
jgi:hypothetical protein